MNVMVFLFAGAGGLLLWWSGSHSSRVRDAQRIAYAHPGLFFGLRAAIGAMPVFAASAFMFAALTILPRDVARWASIAAIDLTFLAIYLVYWGQPFLPRWLRDEVERGVTPLAVPDRWDWVIFWVLVPLAALVNISGVYLAATAT